MAYQFKVGDTGKTRDGRAYRVVAVDVKGPEPIAVLIAQCSGGAAEEYLATRLENGRVGTVREVDGDLIPPTPAVYINVYEWEDGTRSTGAAHDTRKGADETFPIPGAKRIGCIRVPLEARFDD